MKQKLRLFMTTLLCAMFGMAMATEVSWTASEEGYENGEAVTEVQLDDNITVLLDKGTGSNAPAYYNTGEALRVYAGGTLTVSGSGITEISFTFGSGDNTNEITADTGDYANGTWTGSADEVVFTVGGTSKHRRFASISVTYSASGTPTVTVPVPVFEPEGGTFNETQNVIISATGTTVLDIYYTLDGSTPTTSSNLFTEAIVVEETTTVKAIAVDGQGNTSRVATATYTIANTQGLGTAESPYTVADANKLLAAGQKPSNVYVKGIISQIDNVNTNYGNAQYWISDDGTTEGQIESYRGNYLENAAFTSEDQIQLGDVVVIYGNLTTYGSIYEFAAGNYIYSLERPQHNYYLTFEPGSQYGQEGVSVEILAVDAEGMPIAGFNADIYYTTDGSRPTLQSDKYLSAFEIEQTTVINAIALDPNGNELTTLATGAYVITQGSGDSADEPFTFRDAYDVTVNKLYADGTNYYVKGVVVTAPTALSSGTATYWIAENENSEEKIQVYKGKYLDNADFTSTDDVAVGDQLIIYGPLTYYNNTTVEINTGNYIVVKETEQKLVDDPYFSHESCTFDNLIELQIFNDDPEVSIYYTLDGTTPSEENGILYEGMIEIHETTTVKAIAIDDNGNESNVVTATFTYVGTMTIAEAQQVDDNTSVTVSGTVVASAANGAVLYDETDYIYYYNRNNSLNVGDMVTMTGAVSTYGGAKQFSSSATTEIKEETQQVVYPNPVELTAADIDAVVKEGVAPRQYVTVTGVLTISGNYYNIAIDGTTNQVSVVKPAEDYSALSGKTVVINGYEMYTNTNNSGSFVYVVPTEITEQESDVATPYFSHETGEYQDMIEVQIFDDDPDVDIYYTLNGTDPTENSYLYENGPIEITSTTTIKAIAFDDNGNASNIATATYTFPEPSIEVNPVNINSNYFVRVESLDQIEEGDAVLIVNEEAGMALSTEQKANNRGAVEVTISSNNTINLNEIDTEAKLVIAQNNGYYYFYDQVNEGFLYAASSSYNWLRTEAEADANAKAEIQPNEDFSFSIVFQGDNTRNVMQYNTSGLFACYGGATQKPVYLYVEVEKPTDLKADPELAFEKKVVYIPTEITQFQMPAITTAENFDGIIGYNYDDETVITIEENASGEAFIVPVGEGTATLYAVSQETDNFEAGEASITVKVYEIEDGVFDFTKGDYYSGYEPSTNTNATNAGRWRAGNVIMSSSGRNVWYDGANGTTLRLYGATDEAGAGSIIFFAPAGQYITSITGVGQLVPNTGSVERGTWTGFAESVTLTRGESNVTLSLVTVTYASELTEEVTVEETKSFSRTFVPKRNFRLPAGLKGYKVINVTRRQAVFSEVSTLAAGNGVILEGEDGLDSYSVEAIADEDVADDFDDNELKISDGTVIGDEKTIFVYGQPSSDDPLGFYLLREGNTLTAEKCYLEIAEDGTTSESETKYIGIVHENTTAIDNVVRNATVIGKNDVIYNVAGQRVNNPTHGVYIVNGKKILLP